MAREDAWRAAQSNGGKPEPAAPSTDPWKALHDERKARLAELDPWQTDGGVIPKYREPPRWWREYQQPDLDYQDAEPAPADAFLAEAERLREASPRQDLPPAASAVELAERHARATGKPPTEGDVARCAGDLLRARLGRNAA